MTDIMPHRHCMVCGNAIREGLYCDELCESKLKSAQRRQQLIFVAFVCFHGANYNPAITAKNKRLRDALSLMNAIWPS